MPREWIRVEGKSGEMGRSIIRLISSVVSRPTVHCISKLITVSIDMSSGSLTARP